MKVIAFNGSPRKSGNTYLALDMVCKVLNKYEIETEIVTVGNKAISGCIACNHCAKTQNQQCVIHKDLVNEWIQLMIEADGILLGSPVHFASIGGNMKSFLDRAFYVAATNAGGNLFRHKVAASVIAVRRSGGIPAFNELNQYLTYSEMFLASSNYWNVIHGHRPGEIEGDDEGKQIMTVLGEHMAYLLQLIEHGKGVITPPENTSKILTNFIR